MRISINLFDVLRSVSVRLELRATQQSVVKVGVVTVARMPIALRRLCVTLKGACATILASSSIVGRTPAVNLRDIRQLVGAYLDSKVSCCIVRGNWYRY